MPCKEKKQKNQLAVKCTILRSRITKINFQEKLLCNILVKMEITNVLGLILEMSMHNFVILFLE